MKVKSYYASSIEAAMASAAVEMGSDAVLITSRRTGPDAKQLGEYEVVFGSTTDEPAHAHPTVTRENIARESASLLSDVESVRRELEGMRRVLAGAWRNSASGHWSPEVAAAEAILNEADLPRELRDEIVLALQARLRDEALYRQAHAAAAGVQLRTAAGSFQTSETYVRSMIREHLEVMLEISPTLGVKNSKRSIIALVGPTGAGKTTTIAKLAIRYGLSSRRPTLIISSDSYRVGATEQLRMYAAAMGVAFQVVEQPAMIPQVLDEHRGKDLVFIDTPGFGPADMDVAEELARVFAGIPDLDVHLTMPATMQSSSLAAMANRFSAFNPRKAILTKLDECDCLGAALGQALLSALPVSFLTDGQRIPDDIEPATADRVLGFLSAPSLQTATAA